jgi:hypothetical protein
MVAIRFFEFSKNIQEDAQNNRISKLTQLKVNF